MKDVIMFEKITCPKCKKEYQDIEHIFPKYTVRLCWCGTKFTYVKHIVTLTTLMAENNTSCDEYYYEIQTLGFELF